MAESDLQSLLENYFGQDDLPPEDEASAPSAAEEAAHASKTAPAQAASSSAVPPAEPLPAHGVGAPYQLPAEQEPNLDLLLDLKLECTFEVGRANMMVSDLLSLGQGSVIELKRMVGDHLDLLVNGKLIARGEVVVVNEKFGCRILEIVSPEQRIREMSEGGS